MTSSAETAEPAVEITDNAADHRYELRYDGQLAGVAAYDDRDGGRAFTHTEIAPEVEGHGLASQLVRFAMDAEVEAGRTVLAECAYVVHWLDRHPEHPAAG